MHAASNVAALALFGASLVARKRGSRASGKLFGLAGGTALGLGGYLGGHLSYAEGVGVDQTVFEQRPDEWTPVLREGDLPEGESRYAEVDGVGIVVVRWEGEVHALSNRCAHRGGPLDEGEIEDGCVDLPAARLRFRLADGGVERGPSAYPQPRWQVRVSGGVVEVKAPDGVAAGVAGGRARLARRAAGRQDPRHDVPAPGSRAARRRPVQRRRHGVRPRQRA